MRFSAPFYQTAGALTLNIQYERLDPQPQADSVGSHNVQRQWASLLAETVYVPGCGCDFCDQRSQNARVVPDYIVDVFLTRCFR